MTFSTLILREVFRHWKEGSYDSSRNTTTPTPDLQQMSKDRPMPAFCSSVPQLACRFWRLAKRQRGQPLESNSDVGGSQSSSKQSESDDKGSTSGDASDIEDADGGSQGASDSDGGGVAEQEGRKYSTSIGKRCKKWINVCFNRGMQFLENYSRKEWT
ncbi:hypothetical protein WJX75_006645 [Coccomyxa subellipsoidea]|uniref:Uncharacterized protein n=1 Tax=Coccomyxa subellipsoidea TaxID=248742 RepID=A0ABR2Z457_9CHLO